MLAGVKYTLVYVLGMKTSRDEAKIEIIAHERFQCMGGW